VSTSRPGRFTPEERAPGTHWIEGWVDLRAGLDDLEKRKFIIIIYLLQLGSHPVAVVSRRGESRRIFGSELPE
jgi:hypothetical protein